MKIFLNCLALLVCLQAACFAIEIITPGAAWQGRCFSVKIPSAEGISRIEGRLIGQKFGCFARGNDFIGIVGIAPEQKPGLYDLSLTFFGADGGREEVRRKVVVMKTKFPSTWFTLKPARNKLRARDLVNEEWARIEQKLLIESSRQEWQGRFSFPVSGPISMLFGTIEHINRKISGYHRGLDLAVPMGTKVAAANSGKVVFAEKLKAFGGTIVIDHGQGVHTLYFHLSKFLAKVGQQVEKGEIIALSGNSGISSGPHLHWGMSVHDLRIDPAQWTRVAF